MALLKRLKKSKGWLHALCVRLFEEQGLAVVPGGQVAQGAFPISRSRKLTPTGVMAIRCKQFHLPDL